MRFHLIIGTKDADIAFWMAQLPKGSFSHYVVMILKAEAKKKIAVLPVPEEPGLLARTTNATIYFKSDAIEEMIKKIGRGKKGNYIKRIIRKHLEVNYRRTSAKKQNPENDETVIVEEIPTERKLEVNVKSHSEKTSDVPKEENKSVILNESEPKSNKQEHEDTPENDFKAKMMRMSKR